MLVGDDYVEAPGVPVAVVDTVGAGDAFAAAFVHGLASDWPAATIAAFANRAGAVVAGRPRRHSRPDEEPGAAHRLRRPLLRRRVPRSRSACSTGPLRERVRRRARAAVLPSDRRRRRRLRSDRPHRRSIRGSAPGTTCAALAARTEVMADVIVNHISRRSPQFDDFDARGDASPYAGLFLTFARVFPHGAQRGGSARAPRDPSRPAVHAAPDGARRTRAALDDVHERADRHRRPPSRRPAVSRRDPRALRRRRHPRDPPGRGRLRRQEGGHQLLHDPGDARVHRAT